MKNDTVKKSAYSKFDDERSVAMSILPKPDQKIKRRKLLMILLYVGFVGLWAIALAVLKTYAMYVAALSLVTLLILIFFTWRYVKVEYEIAVQRCGDLRRTDPERAVQLPCKGSDGGRSL